MVSDLQFTSAYRVPYQYSPYLRQHIAVGSFMAATQGVTMTDLDGRRFYDLTGSYGVNVFGNDFYKDCMAEAAAQVAELGPLLGSYHPCVAEQRRAPVPHLGARRGELPHVGHRGRDAGGAPGALPHAPQPPGALLRGLPRLVGGCAARHRQPPAAARHLHA